MSTRRSNEKKKKALGTNSVVPPAKEIAIAGRVTELAEPLCTSEGLELVHVEFQREPGGRILRLYIDKPQGVVLDDCANLSRQISDLLDVHFEDIGRYSLEVTSPGSNRPLSKKQDFEKFKGNEIKIKTARPIDGQKKFNGVLMGISAERVNLSIGERKISIPFQDITKARLVNFNGEY